jgi:hypothetical protein
MTKDGGITTTVMYTDGRQKAKWQPALPSRALRERLPANKIRRAYDFAILLV